jgi:ribosomal protein L32
MRNPWQMDLPDKQKDTDYISEIPHNRDAKRTGKKQTTTHLSDCQISVDYHISNYCVKRYHKKAVSQVRVR